MVNVNGCIAAWVTTLDVEPILACRGLGDYGLKGFRGEICDLQSPHEEPELVVTCFNALSEPGICAVEALSNRVLLSRMVPDGMSQTFGFRKGLRLNANVEVP